jgi:signal transduction histidine kinase/HAMP domain-containing protein
VSSRRGFGLQGWLVAALLAVGITASLAVLLVVLPTLESSVRSDRAKHEAEELVKVLGRFGRDPGLSEPVTEADVLGVAERIRGATGAEVAVSYRSDGFISQRIFRTSPPDPTLVTRVTTPLPGTAQIVLDNTAVVASASFGAGPSASGTILAALPLSGVAPELAVVRQRVIIAMIVVLGLATLAGVALARLLGGRIRRLASTAATLAGGDLSARAPQLGAVPEELSTLGQSLNGMAGRLESLVAEITSERDRDRAMIGSLSEGVLAVGPDGAVTIANDAAKEYLGLSDGEESPRLDALPAPIIDAVLAARDPSAPASGSRQVELPGGVELELHVAPLAQDRDAGTVITLRDVTEERRLERARRDLVANVSHELKTPIAALKGFLELLEGDGPDERHRREFLAAMSQETARLERLVEEQLQLARLDTGGLPLVRERVDLDELAAEVVAPRTPLAARDGIALSVRPPAGPPVVVEGDPARLEQVLLILIDNALRHTPRGGEVQVIVARDGQDATLAVRDTGEGIPLEKQPFVFDRYYRGDPSREGRSAGLGLAIARGLAAAHRGSLRLESEVGAGSTFTLRLPLPDPGAITEEAPIPDLSRVPGGDG